MDKGPSNNESHRYAKEEAHPHVPLIHHGVTGEAVVVWILSIEGEASASDAITRRFAGARMWAAR